MVKGIYLLRVASGEALMADETKTSDSKMDVQSPIQGMDESMFAAADAALERSLLERGKEVLKTYQEDPWFRAEASVKISLVINLFYSIYQVYMGIRFESVWFMSLAIYSIMVTMTRAVIVRYLKNDAKDGREEIERYRSCGYLLIMLTFAVGFLSIIINFAGEHPVYPGSMIYVVGGFTIYTVYTSIYDLIIYRKLESPLISASKHVAVACALVSLYSLQAAAVALYLVDDLAWLRARLNLATALIICAVILTFAIHIIVRASRALAGKEDLSFVVIEKSKEINEDNNVEFQHYANEAMRQLEFWRNKDKVNWHTQAGAMLRHDEQVRERLRARAERKEARKKKR